MKKRKCCEYDPVLQAVLTEALVKLVLLGRHLKFWLKNIFSQILEFVASGQTGPMILLHTLMGQN